MLITFGMVQSDHIMNLLLHLDFHSRQDCSEFVGRSTERNGSTFSLSVAVENSLLQNIQSVKQN